MQNKSKQSIYETVLFAVLGAIMFCSKLLMEALPNIHLLGMFTMVFAIVFRKKGLVPIYVYAMLCGLYAGFNAWWVPHLYIWTILFAVTLALPQKMPQKVAFVVYPAVCCLHGLLYGTLYAPAQALFFGLSFKSTIAWIIAGLPFDIIHGVGNFVLGFLVLPLSALLKKAIKSNR